MAVLERHRIVHDIDAPTGELRHQVVHTAMTTPERSADVSAPMAEPIEIKASFPGERIVELVLEIVLEAMRGQTPEQKAQMWDWHIENVKAWRKFWGVDG